MAVKDVVSALIEPQLKILGYDLASVSFRKEGANYILRVVIDKDGPVSMDDIVRAGDLISPLLDEADPISNHICSMSPRSEPKRRSNSKDGTLSQRARQSLPSRSRRKKECPTKANSSASQKKKRTIKVDKQKEGNVTIRRDLIANARLAIKF
jgi:ribosome maturation factor RimP